MKLSTCATGILALTLCLAGAFAAAPAAAQSGSPQFELPSALQGLKVGGVFFLSYQADKTGSATTSATTKSNQFTLKRGYLDVQKTLSPRFMARYTTDITRDAGGNWMTRIKYLYGKFSFAGGDVFRGVGVEFGQVHNPWLDFEESINGFRMQGTMFLERSGVFNSADVGLVAGSDLGGKVDEDFRKHVNGHYAGRWGSWQLGVYNGGGYHAVENNNNKVVEGRATLRPLPDTAPGLQASVLGMKGKGNVASVAPDWTVLDGMLSYQTAVFTGTAQYYKGKGNAGGSAVTGAGDARKQAGWSAFASVRVMQENGVRLIGRYDRFDSDTESDTNDVQKRAIVGIACKLDKGSTLLVDFETVDHSTAGRASDKQGQATLQVKF